jgi:hypothetical protein
MDRELTIGEKGSQRVASETQSNTEESESTIGRTGLAALIAQESKSPSRSQDAASPGCSIGVTAIRSLRSVLGISLVGALLVLGIRSASLRADDIRALVGQPDTFSALISNIKIALNGRLLLRNDFFTSENLGHYFAGRRIEWLPNVGDCQVCGKITEFPSIVPSFVDRGLKISGLSLNFQKLGHPDQFGCTAALQLYVAGRTKANFDSVVSIFGSEWSPSPWYEQMSAHRLIEAPIRPHGNERIAYRASDGPTDWVANFVFAPDATISEARFCAKESTK